MPTLTPGKIIMRSVYDGALWTFSTDDGSYIAGPDAFPTFGYPDSIDCTASGTRLAGTAAQNGADPNGDALGIMDYSFTPLSSTQWGPDVLGHGHSLPVGVDRAGQFYWGNQKPGGGVDAKLRRYSDAGALLTTWTLPYQTLVGFAINQTGTIAYYAEDSYSLHGTLPNLSPLHQWDMSAGAALPDLVAGGIPDAAYGINWIMSSTDVLIVPYQDAPWPTIPTVRLFNISTGSLINEISLIYDNFDGFDISLRNDLNDSGTFWVWYEYLTFGPFFGSSITFFQFDIATGTKLKEFDIVNYDPNSNDPTISPRSNTTWWVSSGPVLCPGEVTAPRQDGLPYAPAPAVPCDGDGTVSGARIGT